MWTTCLLFFQAVLLVGYLYAHAIAIGRCTAMRFAIHAVLLSVSIVALVFASPERILTTLESQPPVAQVILILGLSIGLPYLVLASTSPLCQYWHHAVFPDGGAYRLYAVSNSGSLLGLLSYPLIIERVLPVAGQRMVWLILFGVFSVLSLGCMAHAVYSDSQRGAGQPASRQLSAAPGVRDVTWWLVLAALGSGTLLAATNQMTHEIAGVPFLWVLPLCLYLLTFIICFHRESSYNRRWAVPLLLCTGPIATKLLDEGPALAMHWQVLGYLLLLFAVCICCHGEMVRMKPAPDRLTFFYICVAAGGALGGILVGIIAPLVFSWYWEFHVLLFSSCCAVFLRWFVTRDRTRWFKRRVVAWGPLALHLTLLFVLLVLLGIERTQRALDMRRNFYGAVGVFERTEEKWLVRSLMHGRIVHGNQVLSQEPRNSPSGYYGPQSGATIASKYHPKRSSKDGDTSLHVGVLGLGVGTIGALAHPSDRLDFYEINVEVINLAGQYFTYLDRSPATIRIFEGDGRIELARRHEMEPERLYDILVMDAFSSDAIPMHFLTRECLALYEKCIAPDGLIVFNITNRFVQLDPVLRGLAAEAGLKVVCVKEKANDCEVISYSAWCILTRNEAFLQDPEVLEAVAEFPARDLAPIVWTDDFASLWHVLRWK